MLTIIQRLPNDISNPMIYEDLLENNIVSSNWCPGPCIDNCSTDFNTMGANNFRWIGNKNPLRAIASRLRKKDKAFSLNPRFINQKMNNKNSSLNNNKGD